MDSKPAISVDTKTIWEVARDGRIRTRKKENEPSNRDWGGEGGQQLAGGPAMIICAGRNKGKKIKKHQFCCVQGGKEGKWGGGKYWVRILGADKNESFRPRKEEENGRECSILWLVNAGNRQIKKKLGRVQLLAWLTTLASQLCNTTKPLCRKKNGEKKRQVWK